MSMPSINFDRLSQKNTTLAKYACTPLTSGSSARGSLIWSHYFNSGGFVLLLSLILLLPICSNRMIPSTSTVCYIRKSVGNKKEMLNSKDTELI